MSKMFWEPHLSKQIISVPAVEAREKPRTISRCFSVYYTCVYQILQFINLGLKFGANYMGSVISNCFGNKRRQQTNIYISAEISIY